MSLNPRSEGESAWSWRGEMGPGVVSAAEGVERAEAEGMSKGLRSEVRNDRDWAGPGVVVGVRKADDAEGCRARMVVVFRAEGEGVGEDDREGLPGVLVGEASGVRDWCKDVKRWTPRNVVLTCRVECQLELY